MSVLARRFPTALPGTERLVAAAVVLLPLVCLPGIERSFSTPKLWLLVALDLVVVLHYLRHTTATASVPSWPWLAWVAAVALSSLASPATSLPALLVVLLPLPLWAAPLSSARAIALGSAIESVIAVLQFSGHDPFAWIGWRPESSASTRMVVYGTLGNPDFVAAWLAATLPLCSIWPRRVAVAAVTLQLIALFGTGSRVLLVAVPVAVIVAALARGRGVHGGRFAQEAWRPASWWLLGAAAAVAIFWLSPARSIVATAEGRLYLVRATTARLSEVPLTGYGPGAFVGVFPEWQKTWLDGHPGDRRFAGPVDHAHNDYAEFWVEFGPLGACAFLALCGWALRTGWRRGAPHSVMAALAALLAVALVDFPLHRPAESALLALLGGLVTGRGSTCPVRSNV
jgi:putative inorganic carbon (hco3(-)) transporter